MKKTLLLSLLTFILVLSIITAKASAATPSVIIDGELQSYDQSPIIENGTTLVPLRGIFETLGADVRWDQSNQTVSATYEGSSVELIIGEEIAYVNEEPKELLVPGKIVSNRTLVPLRFVSEALGADVNWDGETRTVTIISSNDASTNPELESEHENDYDKEVERIKHLYPSGTDFNFVDDGYVIEGSDFIQNRNDNSFGTQRSSTLSSLKTIPDVLSSIGVYSGSKSELESVLVGFYKNGSMENKQVGNVYVTNGRAIMITW